MKYNVVPVHEACFYGVFHENVYYVCFIAKELEDFLLISSRWFGGE
jgi:hypothetical protein